MSLIQLIELPIFGDGRGDLVSIEAEKHIPFPIRRVYCLFNLGEHPRGMHAHRQLQQLAFCVHGSCRFVLDDGVNWEDVVLSAPSKGLLIGNLIWREMHDFTDDCVIMVLASEHYDESDYIRDYTTFQDVIRGAAR
uniref:sugar 3,4-ketoisomerase n=1 Tax=Shewanella baltica TaxID=62322 RepID=UPI0040481792